MEYVCCNLTSPDTGLKYHNEQPNDEMDCLLQEMPRKTLVKNTYSDRVVKLQFQVIASCIPIAIADFDW